MASLFSSKRRPNCAAIVAGSKPYRAEPALSQRGMYRPQEAVPEYTGESLLTRDCETGLYGHFNREGYWVEEPATV
jgi:hypothetical protein